MEEPLWMFVNPWVIGRTLKSNVQGDLHATVVSTRHQILEVAQGTKLSVDGFVPALPRSDGPRAARIVWRRGYTVVRALPKCDANGMDWRQIEHIEAHLGDAGQQELHIGEGAMASWIWRCGSRKKLVPTRVAGTFAIDP